MALASEGPGHVTAGDAAAARLLVDEPCEGLGAIGAPGDAADEVGAVRSVSPGKLLVDEEDVPTVGAEGWGR